MINIIAKNNLCFLALLEMILMDYTGIHYFSQEKLVDYFGVTMFKGQDSPYSRVTFTDNEKDVGVHVTDSKLNAFFLNTGIPLKAIHFPANPFHSYPLDNYHTDRQIKLKYIIFTFSYGILFNKPDLNELGHAALYKGEIDNNNLIIYDPGPESAGDKVVDKINMYEAMWARRGGLYCFIEEQ